MKRLIFFFLFSSFIFGTNAQKVIDETIEYANQDLKLDLKFADQIIVKTWDKPEIGIKSIIETKDIKNINLYKYSIQKDEEKIIFTSDPSQIFNQYWKKHPVKQVSSVEKEVITKHEVHGHTRTIVHSSEDFYTETVEIVLPKNAKVTLHSINGDLKADDIEGSFLVDFINGNITVKNHLGNLKLKTINGEIDIPVNGSQLEAETLHGNIYADDQLDLTIIKTILGHSVIKEGQDHKNGRVSLQTINGDIYIRE